MICPCCEKEIPDESVNCPKCTANIREIKIKQMLLEKDSEVRSLDDDFTIAGVVRFSAAIFCAIATIGFYIAMENVYNPFAKFVGALCVVFVPLLVITIIGATIYRTKYARRIRRLLDEKARPFLKTKD